MIVDRIDNWRFYPLGQGWETTFKFLVGVKADIKPGQYPVQGKDILARVSGYRTRPSEECLFEAHREYVDVQVLLSGCEAIEWCPLDGLKVKTPYDANGDAVLFHRPAEAASRIVLRPGIFAVFFPQDGHAPSLTAGTAAESVKKLVMKVRVGLLQ